MKSYFIMKLQRIPAWSNRSFVGGNLVFIVKPPYLLYVLDTHSDGRSCDVDKQVAHT